MKAYKGARLLIVDEDRKLSDHLQETISAWGIKTKTITKPRPIAKQVRRTFYNVVLLDIVVLEKSGFDLISEIGELSPEAKVIIMSGHADKKKAVKALRLGVFDFLEKPIKMELLSHAVKRGLHTQRIELDLKKTLNELEHSQTHLLVHKLKLEQANEQLLETNKALSVLAKNLERTQEESEKRMVKQIRLLITPIVENLQRDKNLEWFKAELTMLLGHIENLTLSLGRHPTIGDKLSSSEQRVASMIMNGLTSQEIANQLHISLRTVETHRKNIRRKLSINHSSHNLKDYLRSGIRRKKYDTPERTTVLFKASP